MTADAVLAALSKLFNWHATRHDDFVSPIVRGMRRAGSPKERARQRVLFDKELRVLWPVLEESGYGYKKGDTKMRAYIDDFVGQAAQLRQARDADHAVHAP
ncbi:MAG: hypothetical protein JO324_08215 [Candidatus Eremiobacteraeota bacterium]|nr:hypothetical protein [Candidatus Eremiobacteraeota bacterium]